MLMPVGAAGEPDAAVTVIVGLLLSVTPLTVTVTVAAVPTVVPVKLVVYVPFVEDSVTVPKVPELVPPDRLKEKALLPRPEMIALVVSLTTIVSVSVFPVTTVDAAKLAEELPALTVCVEYLNWSALEVEEVPYPKIGLLTLSLGLLGSVLLTPDCTVTSTVPDPEGAIAVI
jgi:hypothetical protein